MYCSCQGCGLLDGVLTPVAEHFSGSAKIKIPAAVYYSIVNAGHLDHRRQRLKRLSTHTGPYCRSLPLYLRLLALSPTLSVAFKFCATAIRASSSISVLPITFPYFSGRLSVNGDILVLNYSLGSPNLLHRYSKKGENFGHYLNDHFCRQRSRENCSMPSKMSTRVSCTARTSQVALSVSGARRAIEDRH